MKKSPTFALLLASVLHGLFGEPPTAVHPVICMGNWLSWDGKAFCAIKMMALRVKG